MNIQFSEKRESILKAMLELIAENGLHNTPMSLVSQHSGVSTGAIYHYYSSKEDIINSLYLETKRNIFHAAFQEYDIRASFKDRFIIIWKNYLDFLIQNPLRLSFIEQCATSPMITEETRKKAEQHNAPIFEFIIGGIESGYLKKINIHLITSAIHGAVLNIAKLQLSGKFDITEEMKQQAALISWDGIKKK